MARATVADVHEFALAMPHVRVVYGGGENPVYQIGGKSFVFFRTPRPDAVDPDTGERYPDVIMFWVESEADKLALVQDATNPLFTTPHFDGHPSVLLRGAHVHLFSQEQVRDLVAEAWLSRASKGRGDLWLRENPPVNRGS